MAEGFGGLGFRVGGLGFVLTNCSGDSFGETPRGRRSYTGKCG